MTPCPSSPHGRRRARMRRNSDTAFEHRASTRETRRTKPIPVERALIDSANASADGEAWVFDEHEQVLRVAHVVRLRESCLACHGSARDNPLGTPNDVLGLPMEGYAVGDTYGAFEMICDLGPTEARTAASARSLVLVSSGLAVLAMGGLWLLFRRLLTQPLARCVGGLEALARGDLTTSIESESRGEMGRLAAALNAAIERMRSALGSTASAAEQTSGRVARAVQRRESPVGQCPIPSLGARGDSRFAGGDHVDGAPERRERAAGEFHGEPSCRCRRARRRGALPGDLSDGGDQRLVPPDRRHHHRDRRPRVPDESARAQRCRRGRARRGTGPRIRRGRGGSPRDWRSAARRRPRRSRL
jgi:HAMP domain-containing protein